MKALEILDDIELIVVDGVIWDREEEQEKAILVILKNIQTKKEFRKVVERITPNGQPGNYYSNLRRLTGILDGKQLG